FWSQEKCKLTVGFQIFSILFILLYSPKAAGFCQIAQDENKLQDHERNNKNTQLPHGFLDLQLRKGYNSFPSRIMVTAEVLNIGRKLYEVEMFFKDDANNDPQWSEEQLIAAKFCFAGLVIGQAEVDIMRYATQANFDILEKSWLPQNSTLVDMKIEFGVDVTTEEIVLADIIDNDSWGLWPTGDQGQQKDTQSQDLKQVTPEGLQMVKKNFEWVADRVELLLMSDSQ
ncbi:hypothetical protein STEG23_036492, partial [Scotinomys teguina]